MRWKLKAEVNRARWHKWYAWRPVYVSNDDGNRVVWLEYVYRKRVNARGYVDSKLYWAYSLHDQDDD